MLNAVVHLQWSGLVCFNIFFFHFFFQDIDFDLTNMANILDIPGLRYVFGFSLFMKEDFIFIILHEFECCNEKAN